MISISGGAYADDVSALRSLKKGKRNKPRPGKGKGGKGGKPKPTPGKSPTATFNTCVGSKYTSDCAYVGPRDCETTWQLTDGTAAPSPAPRTKAERPTGGGCCGKCKADQSCLIHPSGGCSCIDDAAAGVYVQCALDGVSKECIEGDVKCAITGKGGKGVPPPPSILLVVLPARRARRARVLPAKL